MINDGEMLLEVLDIIRTLKGFAYSKKDKLIYSLVTRLLTGVKAWKNVKC